MTFFELRDYIPVTQKVRNYLELDNITKWKGKECTFYVQANQSWPYISHWQTLYLRPCTIVQTGDIADYQLYYNIPTIPV
jgi:hypothetical protein